MGLLDDAERNRASAKANADATWAWLSAAGGNLRTVEPDLLSTEHQQVVRDLFARTPGEPCYVGTAPDGHTYVTTATTLAGPPRDMVRARQLVIPSSTYRSDDTRTYIRLVLTDDGRVWSDLRFYDSARRFADFAAEHLQTAAEVAAIAAEPVKKRRWWQAAPPH